MSYFFDAFDDFYIQNRSVSPDKEGGTITEWSDGAIIKASLDLGGSTEVRQAEAQNLKTVFTATFLINTPVQYNDYIKNVKTGKIYRITSEPRENETPPTAKYQSCFATAVKAELPQ